MTTVVISQPMYFPWPGFMAQMALADVHVWLDDVQFSKGSFTNRIQVGVEGGRKWMTVPLAASGAFHKINEMAEAQPDWRARHREFLAQQLGKQPYFKDALQLFDEACSRSALCDVLIASAEVPAKYLGVLPSRIVRSSSLNLSGSSWQRVLEIVLTLGGTRYLTGHGAKHYLDCAAFQQKGVEVEFMDYDPLPWRNHRSPFNPYVTILEPISHEGSAVAGRLNPRTIGWRKFTGA
jgi:hypothetical protein